MLGTEALDLTVLLLRSSLTDSTYEIEITDLSRVWNERLSKRDIIRRASDNESHIDPSESDDQFRILLGKIESALSAEKDTSLVVSHDYTQDNAEALRLDLTASLPKPLAPFTWTVHLKRSPESAIRSSLVLPLLQQSNALQVQIRSLVEALSAKDRVISRLSDRLETSGNELKTVFPGVSNVKSNREHSQRDQLAGHVEGLAVFDELTWRRGQVDHHFALNRTEIDEACKGLSTKSEEAKASPTEGNWWERLPKESLKVFNGGVDRAQTTASRNPDMREARTIEDSHDEFERQSTPPYSRMSNDKNVAAGKETPRQQAPAQAQSYEAAATTDDGSTTEDEDDLDSVVEPPRYTQRQEEALLESPKEVPKRLGTIGGPSTRPASRSTGKPMLSPALTTGTAQFKFTIGGKSSILARSRSEATPGSTTSPTHSPDQDTVDDKKQKSHSHVPDTPQSQPSLAIRDESNNASELQLDDPEERANRRRKELKNELERKARAPLKKKRKF